MDKRKGSLLERIRGTAEELKKEEDLWVSQERKKSLAKEGAYKKFSGKTELTGRNLAMVLEYRSESHIRKSLLCYACKEKQTRNFACAHTCSRLHLRSSALIWRVRSGAPGRKMAQQNKSIPIPWTCESTDTGGSQPGPVYGLQKLGK